MSSPGAHSNGFAAAQSVYSLPKVSPHFSPAYLGLSVAFFSCVYLLGRLLLPLLARYRLWSKDEQYHARGIVPSSTFILVIVPMSLWALLHDTELRETRVVGSTEWSRMVIHIAAGYFVYDSTIVLIHVKLDGLSYLIHGVVCLVTYGLAALFDVYHYYGPTFLIFETTTIFINMKWCLSRSGYRNSQSYVLNGICLMIAWFLVRILFGYTMSTYFWIDTLRNLEIIPGPIMLWYTFSNICLNGLNTIWFMKIVKGVLVHVFGKKGNFRGKKSD